MNSKIRINDNEIINISNSSNIISTINDDNDGNDIKLNNITFYSKNNLNNNNYQYEVKSIINIDCSLQELINIFYTKNDINYNIFMKELYRYKFINGSILHFIKNVHTNYISIKQCYFKQLGLLASTSRNDSWCYIEDYTKINNGLIIKLTSVDENKILHKSNINNVNYIRNLCCIYDIKILYKNSNLAENNSIYTITFNGNVDINSKIAKNHLKYLAKSLQFIPNIVIKNRLTYQIKANLDSCKIFNSKCINCSKKIKLRSIKWMKKRCEICSYNTCNNCAIKKEIFNNDETKLLNICLRCFECVNRCNYSDIKFNKVKISNNLIMDNPDIPHAGIRILQFLKEKISKKDQKESIINILEQVPQLNRKRVIIDESKNTYNSFISNRFSDNSILSSTYLEYRDEICINSMEEYLNDIPLLEDCKLSNIDFRTYPIETSSFINPEHLVAPIPENEEERLIDINKFNIDDLHNINELNIICDTINNEMKTLCTMITIIDKDSLHVIAANNKDFINIYPRNESICQHTIMDDKPMLLTNPEADIRYYNLNQIKTYGIKFYFGVPIKSINNNILGSLCCIDTNIKDLTVSQYSIISKFADTTSKIIEQKILI